MMQQYQAIKQQYPDCLLFFRMGDFYELFLTDAEVGAEILDITLTSRSKGKDGRIPMAGVPYHAINSYLAKLVKAGHKVAICEQTSQPDGSGIVEREVVRVVTPGTVLDETSLEQKQNNYLIALTLSKDNLGLALTDISTGEFRATEINSPEWPQILSDELAHLQPTECILSDELYNNPDLLKILKTYPQINIFPFSDWDTYTKNSQKHLQEHFSIKNLNSFGLDNLPLATEAASVLLGYLQQTQKQSVTHIKKITAYEIGQHLVMDRSTIINLELFSTIREGSKKGTLLHLLDHTSTSMGGRLLRQWLAKPLTDANQIQKRLDGVEELINDSHLRTEIHKLLKQVSDLQRIISRLSLGVGNARDMVQLKHSLQKMLGNKTNSESTH